MFLAQAVSFSIFFVWSHSNDIAVADYECWPKGVSEEMACVHLHPSTVLQRSPYHQPCQHPRH